MHRSTTKIMRPNYMVLRLSWKSSSERVSVNSKDYIQYRTKQAFNWKHVTKPQNLDTPFWTWNVAFESKSHGKAVDVVTMTPPPPPKRQVKQNQATFKGLPPVVHGKVRHWHLPHDTRLIVGELRAICWVAPSLVGTRLSRVCVVRRHTQPAKLTTTSATFVGTPSSRLSPMGCHSTLH